MDGNGSERIGTDGNGSGRTGTDWRGRMNNNKKNNRNDGSSKNSSSIFLQHLISSLISKDRVSIPLTDGRFFGLLTKGQSEI